MLNRLPLHPHIQKKLDYFYENQKIPNLIFHGSSGTGKRTIVHDFLNKIYGSNKQKLKTNVMMVNCAHGKGIKFIREELKFFAKTNIQSNSGVLFKSIVLSNADCLTIDAQSALRRCIELFSHNTRFFIIVENKHKLLNPILSRFCEIYVPEYVVDGKIINLHTYLLDKKYKFQYDLVRKEFITAKFQELMDQPTSSQEQEHNQEHNQEQEQHQSNDFKILIDFCSELYEKGYSALDLMQVIQESEKIDEGTKASLMLDFQKVKAEFRYEKLLMFYITGNLRFPCTNPPLISIK
jgi:Cdc6-like AAA superfamily ATPase